MEKIMRIASVSQCNDIFHQKTRHPLVSVVDLSEKVHPESLLLDFFAILLEEENTGDHSDGWYPYDFSDGTVLFFSPNVPYGMTTNCFGRQGYLLLFHPELIKGTSLDRHIKEYSFFGYQRKEALHTSEREKKVLVAAMKSIGDELNWGIDEYSKILLVNKIETLLNYCSRFYKRQFITRHEANEKIVEQTEQLIEKYYLTRRDHCKKFPTAGSLANTFDLSANYFEDLLKHETGKNMSEYLQSKRIDMARERLSDNSDTVDRIARDLGFSTPQSFCRLFKKLTGRTPEQYRMMN